VNGGTAVLLALTFQAAITEEQREFLSSLVEDMNHKTLGRLLRSIKGLATFDQSFLSAVEVSVHGFEGQ